MPQQVSTIPSEREVANALGLVNWEYVANALVTNPTEVAYWATTEEQGGKLHLYPPSTEENRSLKITFNGEGLDTSSSPPFLSGKASQIEFWEYHYPTNTYSLLFYLPLKSPVDILAVFNKFISGYDPITKQSSAAYILDALGVNSSSPVESSDEYYSLSVSKNVVSEGDRVVISVKPSHTAKEFRKAYLAFYGSGLTKKDFSNSAELGIGSGLSKRLKLDGKKEIEISLNIAADSNDKEATFEDVAVGLFSSVKYSSSWVDDPYRIANIAGFQIKDTPNVPTAYSSTWSKTEVGESGKEADITTITLSTPGMKNGEKVYWQVSSNSVNSFGKDAVNTYDFGASGLNRFRGFARVKDQKVEIPFQPAKDRTNEGNESFVVTFYSDRKLTQSFHRSNQVTILDTSTNSKPSIKINDVSLASDLSGREIGVDVIFDSFDSEGDPIVAYRLLNTPGAGSGYFRFGGKDYDGEVLEVATEKLGKVKWVIGKPGSVDNITCYILDNPGNSSGQWSDASFAEWSTKPASALKKIAVSDKSLESILVAPNKQKYFNNQNLLESLDKESEAVTVQGKGKKEVVFVNRSGLIGVDAGTLIGPDGGTLIGVDAGTLIGPDGGTLIGVDAGT